MNQKTQQCVQSDAKPCICREFTEKLYFSTLDLWKHHNDTLLKWPQVIIGGTIFFLLNIVNNDKATIILSNPQNWGDNSFPQRAIGSLLILGGLAIIAMLYVMRRARTIMGKVEAELDELSKGLFKNENYFKSMNHPDGLSGRTLVWFFMAFFLAFPMTIIGFCVICGLDRGFRYWIPFAIALLILFFHGFIIGLFKERFKKPLAKRE